jgi:hypothetical protein
MIRERLRPQRIDTKCWRRDAPAAAALRGRGSLEEEALGSRGEEYRE